MASFFICRNRITALISEICGGLKSAPDRYRDAGNAFIPFIRSTTIVTKNKYQHHLDGEQLLIIEIHCPLYAYGAK